MSWLERDEGPVDVVIGDCFECTLIQGTRDLYVCLADTVELANAQRRLVAHFAAVLHLDSPGIAW